MDSIYHLDPDLECKVLHYGDEVCLATPGEYVTISLRKGRHRLTFISTENPADQYSIMYNVPDNDIEDCIEIQLIPTREQRLVREAEEKRIAEEEAQRQLLEDQRRKELEREALQRKAEEQKKREEEAERIRRKEEEEMAWKRKVLPLVSIFKEAKKYDDDYWGTWAADYSLFPRRFKNGKIGFINNTGDTIINPIFELRQHTPSIYGFYEGLSCAIQDYVPCAYVHLGGNNYSLGYLAKICFIDSTGKIILSSNYFLPKGICAYGRPILFPYFSQDRVIVRQCEIIGTTEYILENIGSDNKEWEEFIKNPTPGKILEKKFADDGASVEKCRVEMPAYSSKYLLIDKKGTIHCEIPTRKGYIPLFNPFSQGLSIIIWTCRRRIDMVEVIDRDGREVLTYNIDKEVVIGKSDVLFWGENIPAVFIGEEAYIFLDRKDGKVSYLRLNVDGSYGLESLEDNFRLYGERISALFPWK